MSRDIGSTSFVHRREKGFLQISIMLQPNANKGDCILGAHDNYIKIKISEPPVEGRANQYLIRFLAMKTGIPKSCFSVVRGLKSKYKTLLVKTDKHIDDLIKLLK